MRIIFCIFFTVQMISGSYGQVPVYFNKILSSIPGTSTISTVIEADSGYLLVVDNISPGQGIPHTLFLMTNLNGEIIDSASFPDNKYYYTNAFPGNTILRTHSGNFVIATSRIDTSDAGYAVLMCLDTNLDTLWTRTFTHPDTVAATQPGAYVFFTQTAIRQTWDNGYIIAGNYSRNCDQNQMRSYLLKTDSLGMMEWIKKYNSIQHITSILTSPDSGFFFPAYYNGQMSLIKTDPLGSIQWSVKINSNTNPSFPTDLAIQDDSNIVVVSGFWYDLTWNWRAVTVAKVNYIQPSKVWEKNYYLFRNFRSLTNHQIVSMHTLPDASIVIGSNSETLYDPMAPGGTAAYKGVMLKLSPDEDSLWARYYRYGLWNHVCQFEHMIPTADSGFLAVGFYWPWSTPSRPWLVKMDSLGCDTPGCHLIGIEELSARQHGDMTLFPNPFSHELNIVLPNGPAGATATLFDTQGRIMHQTLIPEFLHTEHYTLQTHDLPPGIYILQLVTKEGATHVGRVVRGN